MNKVILIGRLGKDAEVKRTEGGAVRVTFTIATSEKFTDKHGNRVENTEWHNVKAWGERWEKLAQYLTKGKQLMVDGKLRYREFEENGQKRRFSEVEARNMELLSGGDKSFENGAKSGRKQGFSEQSLITEDENGGEGFPW
jgi:single-strand DNA-binding protein